jgi:hypothetical protein
VTDPTIAFGILKCRDLVQLYYGARLVASVIETVNEVASDAAGLLLNQDPRLIKYEIQMSNTDTVNPLQVFLGSTLDAVLGGTNFLEYNIPINETVIVERNFFTDLDAVTLPVFVFPQGANFAITTRETFLTPAPVDEGP